MTDLNRPRPSFATKRELAIITLTQAIRSGRYTPGQTLSQVQLMQDLGLGSTPVREAILKLLAQGILVQESHHSVRVAELDLQRLRDIYRARMLLETEAARLATARISDSDIEYMGELLAQMEQSKLADDLTSVARADSEFHHVLYTASPNLVILNLIKQLWDSFPGNILWNIPGRVAASLVEHRRILDALRERDASSVAFAVSNHLMSALAALETYIVRFNEAAKNEGS